MWMTADRKKLVGRILMISSTVILTVNVVLSAKGRSQPVLLAVGALCLILGIAMNAGAKRGGG
jgi:hypothetical protein